MNDQILQRVTVDIQCGIATVTLQRAEKRNALDLAMFLALDRVSKSLRHHRDIRVIILRGEGEDFCSGLDIKSVLGNTLSGLKLLWKWLPGNANLAQRVCVNWRKIPVPVIAVLHGRCWGGGLQIALGADYRIAHPQSSLSIMEAKWGIIPDMGGSLTLSELLRVDTAMYLASTAEIITASDAQHIGLVSEIHEDPYQRALELAQQYVSRSPDSVAAVKQLYHRFWCPHPRKLLAAETLRQWRLLFGTNQKIAVRRSKGDEQAIYKQRA